MALIIENRRFNGVITDVDGTFYDQDTLSKIFEGVRINLTRNLLEIQGNTSPTNDQIEEMKLRYVKAATEGGSFKHAFVSFGGDPDRYETMAEYIDKGKYLQPNPELLKVIQELRQRARVAILSSTTEESLETACQKLFGDNWRAHFDAIVCNNTPGVKSRKPDPEIFLHTLRLLNTLPEETIMIGDSDSADLRPAARLGMFRIQVGNTDSGVANLYVKSFTDLRHHLLIFHPGHGPKLTDGL